jgi:hypothetical protein
MSQKRISDAMYIEDFDILHVYSPFNWRNPHRYLTAAIRFCQTWRYGPEASHYSHTAMAVWHGPNLYIYEADPQVKKTLFADWVKDKEIAIARIPARYFTMHGSDKVETRTILKSKLGLRYDYVSLVFFQILLILSGKWYGTKNSNAFYCSEFTSWIVYLSTGLMDKWYSMSPARSYRFCKNEDWICHTGKAADLISD